LYTLAQECWYFRQGEESFIPRSITLEVTTTEDGVSLGNLASLGCHMITVDWQEVDLAIHTKT